MTKPPILFEARMGARSAKPRLGTRPGKPIRVVAVDDHFAVRAALTDTIQSQEDMLLAGIAATADDARELLASTRPDVAIIDINLGESSGFDLIREIQDDFPEVRTVVFSIFEEAVYADRARRAGARAYVTKSESTQRVVEAIRIVAGGGTLFHRRTLPTHGKRRAGDLGEDSG